MVQYVITPWRNRAELLHIRQQLYPGAAQPANEAERRRAVAQVSVWMQRGNCPHLVESTAILTSAMLNDVPGNSTYCVRAAYSAAFCRFVTGLLDSHQDKRRKLSMYSVAKTIGLPATYVELRHQATHEELPSLQKLRTAARKALRWIWDHYWAQLSSDIPSGEDCKTYVQKFLSEKDGQGRQEIAERLMKWDEDELISTLMEFNVTVDDTGVLLKSLRLSRRVLDAVESKGSGTSSEKMESMEDIRVEMARMENGLAQSDEEDGDKEDEEDGGENLDSRDDRSTGNMSSTNALKAMEGKGWVLWEGPWVPKPIGTI